MAVVHIPAPLRSLTGGETDVVVPGATLAEVVEALEERFPGLKSRLTEGDRIRPGMAVFVGGVQTPFHLSTRVPADAEIYFAPAISGG
ncbi:MAG TPA: MoaD/ThiS family protein [Chthonomonadaceae bacterium]|nr:MoaD/ThiS family protein [Chthonomonadaceae bacterium]